MGDTKQDLAEQAEALGIEGADKMSKGELEEALEARNTSGVGPHVPEGEMAPEIESGGNPTPGVQPIQPDDIPESAR